MAKQRIVVVGAGVSGLTTALLLSKNANYEIIVAAKHMPGDYSIEYASPWAGANYLPVSAPDTAASRHDADTWPEFEKLAREHPEAGIHFQDTKCYNRAKDLDTTARTESTRGVGVKKAGYWYKDLVPNFRPLTPPELPPGHDSGVAFTSVCINTALYLPYLVSRCLAAGNVTFTRATFSHISAAASTHHSGQPASVVVNCTGLDSRNLGGVADQTLTPARGQTVLVRNAPAIMCASSGTDDGDEEVCYVMQRAAGGGTILGGCYQKGNWNGEVDEGLSLRIMQRAVKLCPSLTGGEGVEGLDVIRAGVGLRPVREGGVRLEREEVRGVQVVHNYGHGGFGYQSSYGCAIAAVRLTEIALMQ